MPASLVRDRTRARVCRYGDGCSGFGVIVQKPVLDEWIGRRVHRSLVRQPPALVTTDVFETLLVSRLSGSARIHMECAALIARWPQGRVPPLAWLVRRRRDWEARRQPRSVAGTAEWSLMDWCVELSEMTACACTDLWSAMRSAWIAVTASTHRRNDALWTELQSYRSRGGRVVAVSDTWADGSMIGELLTAHGIEVDAVYASSEVGCSKVAGGLHRHVASLEGAGGHAGPVLHVGDDLRADGIRAIQSGAAPLWVPRQLPLQRRIRRVVGSSGADTLVEMFRAGIPCDVGTVESTTASVVLPTLLCLHAATSRLRAAHDSDLVLYIARDAWLMQKVQHAVERCRPLGAPTAWLRLSRRVVTLAHPADLLGTMTGVAGRKGKETVGRLLRPFSLGEALEGRLLEAAGLSARSANDVGNRAVLASALRAFAGEVEAARHQQRELLRAYVEPLVGTARAPMVVDSGWVGTSQDTLGAVFPEWSKVGGVYLGVSVPHALGERYWRWGLLRDDQPGVGYGRSVDRLASTLRVWEVMLREPAGSVVGLKRQGGSVVPLLQAVDGSSPEVVLGCRVGRAMDEALLHLDTQLGALLVQAESMTLEELRHAAAIFSAPFVYSPGPALAADVLRAGYDEAAGHRRSLATLAQDPRDVWWPGVVAAALARVG